MGAALEIGLIPLLFLVTIAEMAYVRNRGAGGIKASVTIALIVLVGSLLVASYYLFKLLT